MITHDLRTLIIERINLRWSDWAGRHPNLARAIDRTLLVESTVDLLRDDPEFIQAMREANLDEAKLALAASILDRADQFILAALPH
jgi:hypothetical protein